MENIKVELKFPTTVDPKNFEIGVLMCRMQVAELHDFHIKLIDTVCENHKKVIILLGVPRISQTEKNPLDFTTRKLMIQERYPNITILPQRDERKDEVWSAKLDEKLNEVYHGSGTFLLYGSRDSFIPHYKGRYKTVELISSFEDLSGTQIRKEIARQPITTVEARRGAIYANFGRYPVTFPCVDVVAYNDNGEILMAKKPNEDLWRFVGGFVDRTDENYEAAAKREFSEESGGCEISDLKYVASGKIRDWRYKGEKDGIMSTLFIGKFSFGKATPTDDIAVLQWLDWRALKVEDIMEEHQEIFVKLQAFLAQEELTPLNN
jgi:bifunctional NMN adenylyltransferase/nudix hydrolase